MLQICVHVKKIFLKYFNWNNNGRSYFSPKLKLHFPPLTIVIGKFIFLLDTPINQAEPLELTRTV